MAVDIFVDKPPLTSRNAFIYAAFNKLLIQKAKKMSNKIMNLTIHDLSATRTREIFLLSRFVHN